MGQCRSTTFLITTRDFEFASAARMRIFHRAQLGRERAARRQDGVGDVRPPPVGTYETYIAIP